ncbi:AAA family ATPase [uncultured Polaribacter sp.]|uniref:AAA family ATPase n=1 Tax=uncultured Polaribacter sp. TaxID=174711 RepID=UPI00263546B0|nr:AAA family ATPase [uncultured Polaribacter sp.]
MERIKLSNFRKIKDSWDLDLAPITFFTGTNNSGKSTVIKSLLVLEDYVKSNNHFELNFNGQNFHKHKIENYKNAINRVNFREFNKDIHLEYQNNGFEISILFQPGVHYYNGTLKKLKMVRTDKATLEIDLVSLNNYQLKVDALLLNQNDKENIEDKKDKLKTLALLQTTSNLINFDKKELKELEKEIEKYTDEIQLIDKSNFHLENIKKENSDVFINKYKSLISENRKKIFELNQTIADTEKKLKILQKKRNEIVHQKKDHLTYSPTFSVDDFDISNRRIDKIIRTVLPKYLVENNLGQDRKKNNFKNSDQSLELDKANKLGDELLLALSFNVTHLSPHRSNQNKLFLHEIKDVDINYLVKNHFEKQLHSDLTVLEFMKKWMSKNYFDIGDDYRITTYESTVSKIEVFEGESWINLSDKGFGAGQVFSILLAIASSIIENHKKINEKGALFEEDLSIILIEEPEANLHPKLQSLLAELFLEANLKFGINFILETHSEYMIRMSQIIVKQINEKEENTKIPFEAYYFDKDAKPYSMIYRKDGKFTNEFGSGFFDVSSNLAFDIL